MGLSNKLIFLMALGVVCIATNPKEKNKFDEQFQEKLRKNQTFMGEGYLFSKVANLFNMYDIKNFYFFSLAYLNEPNRLIAIGALSTWFFVNNKELQ
ncbi:hypothetical protein RB653_002751 [Dictyostelium firmibasis]|uniref:Uncharacterized protein n=1 Tax=Dictyostelium firmibasis TaxID=79012 RepID=A0AAN7UA37_9MYCE